MILFLSPIVSRIWTIVENWRTFNNESPGFIYHQLSLPILNIIYQTYIMLIKYLIYIYKYFLYNKLYTNGISGTK